MASNKQFTVVDYAVFGIAIVASIVVGIVSSLLGVKSKTLSEYMVGNRRLGVLPVSASLLMTWVSASELLGITAEVYHFGTQAFMDNFGKLLAIPIPILLIVPLFHPLKLTSVFEYLELRYNSAFLHIFTCIVYFQFSILMNGIQLYGPSTAFEAVTGISYQYCIVATGLVVTSYTALGGIRGVVWADLFQGVILFTGILVMLVAGVQKVGGLNAVWNLADEGRRIRFFDFNPDPTQRMTFWTSVLGGASRTVMFGAVAQTNVQRFSAVSSVKKGISLYVISFPAAVHVDVLLFLTGLTIYAYYAGLGCDPTSAGKVANFNQILPYFMMDVLNTPGLPGLFIAVLFSACLSTNSTRMNGSVTILYKGFVERLLKRFQVAESRRLLFGKIMVFAYGLMGILVGLLIPFMDGHVIQVGMGIGGGILGPVAGAIFIGLLIPFAQWKGAFLGIMFGIIVTSWINIGKHFGDSVRPHMLPLSYNSTVCDPAIPHGLLNSSSLSESSTLPYFALFTTEDDKMFVLYRISFMYMAAVGFVVTFTVGLVCSVLTGPAKPGSVDPRTTVSWSRTIFFRYFSPRMRNKLLCGYEIPTQDEADPTKGTMLEEKAPATDASSKQADHNSRDSDVLGI